VTGGKPIAVLLQSISGVSAINPLVAFYDIHGVKRGAIFYFVPDTKRNLIKYSKYILYKPLTKGHNGFYYQSAAARRVINHY
jgi:hypothetical protein